MSARNRAMSITLAGIVAGAVALAFGQPARADLTLTQAGIDQGLSLTTFANGFPSSGGVGPLGVVFPSTGGVLVSDRVGNVRLFPTDADGQNAASAPQVGPNYGDNNAAGLVKLGNAIFMSQFNAGTVAQLNADGTFNQTVVTGVPGAAGIVVNPADGHLLVASNQSSQIFDVDPLARTKAVFHAVSGPDGLSVSPDGKTLYVAATGTGHLLGFDIQSGATVFDSGFIPGGIDGTAAGVGLFSDFIFANANNGTVVEVNLKTLAQTVIATGGSRGDFVTVDPSNDTLLLTQTDRIVRLSGATFVPEPTSLALTGIGAASLLACCWRLRHERATAGATSPRP